MTEAEIKKAMWEFFQMSPADQRTKLYELLSHKCPEPPPVVAKAFPFPDAA